ncbi:hypothetical protein OMO38_19180 [Chryseobacterium sp. 09-1422]|uniref:DUF4240 domain-containing protein n=1 Tax=Chryseobacterium kimseyorum TaxID=2984028 RepID=A0ABT3I3Q6_9FLAO|nr:hypothetical protein [Chryseobacterium kimseyorum]MCW3170658.1 hypothetical protein [Chryseobacterium kimseyorum]
MEFFVEIKTADQAFQIIKDWIAEDIDDNGYLSKYDKEAIYNSAIWAIQEVAEHKNIEYQGYFRTKYEKNSEFQRILGKTNFEEQTYKRELYVLMAAQDDQEIFDLFKYIFDITQPWYLDDILLSEMITKINSKGYLFHRT